MTHSLPSNCWKLVGQNPGPRVCIIGGTHGDESLGIEVVKGFLHTFGVREKESQSVDSADIQGELILMFGNPEAIVRHARSASGGRDLNRSFVQDVLDAPACPDDSLDLIRAREIAPLLASADYVFDIHGTSNPSPPFVCFGTFTPEHVRLCQLLPVQYVLTDPHNVLAKDEGTENRGTTDEYVEAHGGVAFGYETGQESDLTRVDSVTDDLIRLLHAVGSVSLSCTNPKIANATACAPHDQRVFALADSVQAKSSDFTYELGMDSGWQPVKAGQVIGRYADGIQEIVPRDGMLLFPKSEKKIAAGKNMYYIAEPVTRILPDSMSVSVSGQKEIPIG